MTLNEDEMSALEFELIHFSRSFSCILFPMRQEFNNSSEWEIWRKWSSCRSTWLKLSSGKLVVAHCQEFINKLVSWNAQMSTINAFNEFFSCVDKLPEDIIHVSKEDVVKFQLCYNKIRPYIEELCEGSEYIENLNDGASS